MIEVHWNPIAGSDDPAWTRSRLLYAYLHPRSREILYIGKADGCRSTVRSRWNASDKQGLWRDLKKERGVKGHLVLVGDVVMAGRLSRQLLADIESLLIFACEPWGNIACQNGRIARKGLTVTCLGRHWPGPRVFNDEGEIVSWTPRRKAVVRP